MDHEAALTRAFILSAKRARFIQTLANPKRRRELLDRLGRELHYMAEFASEVPGELDFPDELEKLLRARGAGNTCHVISGGLKADGREIPLREALDQICLRESGSILSCIPGVLAYYRPEYPGRGIILQRHQG